MPISIELKPEVEERLGREASARGVSVEAYVEDLIERRVSRPGQTSRVDPEELDRVLDSLAEGSEERPAPPPEAYTREYLPRSRLMRYLVDSNVLLRLLQRSDPQHNTIRRAVRALSARGDELCCAPQNIVELWNVSTRPASARGGFGLTVAEMDRRVRLIERVFTVLEETPAVYPEWRRLVVSHAVMGVQVHDARIAALMNVHGVTHVLTLNAKQAKFPVDSLGIDKLCLR